MVTVQSSTWSLANSCFCEHSARQKEVETTQKTNVVFPNISTLSRFYLTSPKCTAFAVQARDYCITKMTGLLPFCTT